MNNKCLCTTLLFIFAIVLIVGLYSSTSNCGQEIVDNYCLCSGLGGRARECNNPIKVQQQYQDGLTENSKLVDPKWTKISPGDYNYPPSGSLCKTNGYV